MPAVSETDGGLDRLAPEDLRRSLVNFLPKDATAAERVCAIENALRSPLGQSMRDTMARWIVDEIVPVKRLVPEAYLKWRPPVRDAMMFVVARLSRNPAVAAHCESAGLAETGPGRWPQPASSSSPAQSPHPARERDS